jgi:hypothetical protein
MDWILTFRELASRTVSNCPTSLGVTRMSYAHPVSDYDFPVPVVNDASRWIDYVIHHGIMEAFILLFLINYLNIKYFRMFMAATTADR